jgi:hypothetical protein
MIRVFLLAAFGLFTVVGTGCSASDDPSAPMMGDSSTTTMAAPGAVEVCANHEEGCPCDKPGDLIDCGRVKRTAGDYVWCSTGMQTCGDDGTWGKCIGDATADNTAAQ